MLLKHLVKVAVHRAWAIVVKEKVMNTNSGASDVLFCFVLFFLQGAPPTGMEQAVFDTMKTSLWDHVDKVTFLVIIAVKLAHFQKIYCKSQFFHFILSFWIAALISTAGEL